MEEKCTRSRSFGGPDNPTDVVFVSSDGCTIDAHSQILRQQSPVFGAMLKMTVPPRNNDDDQSTSLDDAIPLNDFPFDVLVPFFECVRTIERTFKPHRPRHPR